MSKDLAKDRILDKAAYKKYVELLDHPMFGKERLIVTSVEGLEIDPQMNKGAISNSLKRVPRGERGLINNKIAVWRLGWDKLQRLKVKSFGVGKGASTKVISDILEERREELVAFFGSYRSYDEILKLIRLDWGYDCTKTTLIKFKAKYKDEITTSTIEFHKDHSHLRLSHKRGRLEELEAIYGIRKKRYQENPTIANERQLQAIIQQISKEVEDKTIRMDVDIRQTIEQNINVRLQQEVMGNLPITNIIIARAAHKMGVAPAFIISRLYNSLYASMAGAKAPEDTLATEEIQYPSAMVYNWKEIRKQHKEHGDVGLELTKFEEIPVEQKAIGTSLKEQIRAKIKAKQAQISITQEQIREKDLEK